MDQFTFTRFEPHGRVEGHDNIRLCTSVVDYVFRVLGLEYLDRTDLAQVKPEELGMVRSPEHATGKPVGFEHHRGPNGDAKPVKHGASEAAHATGHAGTAGITASCAPANTTAYSGAACGNSTAMSGTEFTLLANA